MDITIRKYHPNDLPEMLELFRETVQSINSRDYSSEQIAAWVSGADIKKWEQTLLEHYSLVACDGDTIVGFGDIDLSGYLDRLYVHKDYQRMGVASRLLGELESVCAAERITTYASVTARPFFEAMGYIALRENRVIRKDVALINYLMEKQRHFKADN